MQTAITKRKGKLKNNDHLKNPRLVVALNSSGCKLKTLTHTASDFTDDTKVQPVQSSLCLNTPKMQSCSLEVISDQKRLAYSRFSLSLSRFVSPGERQFEGWKCATRSVITSRNAATAGVSQTWATDHASSWTQWQRNTKPWHTHSPTAGALLQTSTICCSSNENGKGGQGKE